MKKKIRISEESLNKIFGKDKIDEISHRKVDNALGKSNALFDDMTYAFNDFYDTVKYSEDVNNPYIIKIKKYADIIKSLLNRKNNQANNFSNELNKFDYKAFYNDKTRPEDEENYDDLDLTYLQNKYPKIKGEL